MMARTRTQSLGQDALPGRLELELLEKIKNTLHSAVRSNKNYFLTKTQLCKLRGILRSYVLRGVYTLVKDTGRRLPC